MPSSCNRSPLTCSLDECARPPYIKGLCKRHYQKQWRYGDPRGGVRTHGSIAERFWNKVDKDGDEPDHVPGIGGCWGWVGSINRTGYGRMSAPGTSGLHAHRVSWELANGPIPDGMWVLHRCDNRRCVNPAHLFLGTAKDNVRDMVQKGRARGRRSATRVS